MGGGLSLLNGCSRTTATNVDTQASSPRNPEEDENLTIINRDVSQSVTDLLDNQLSGVNEGFVGSPSHIPARRNEGEVNSLRAFVLLTPREGNSTNSHHSDNSQGNSQQIEPVLSIPYTPHGDEAAIYKYYCPLCMQYFRDIMKMKCCGNYLCLACLKDYLQSKRVDLTGLDSQTCVEDQFMHPNTIPCPHCGVSGFHPLGVSFEEAVRDYSSRLVPSSHIATNPGYSPLRIGESFEDLKRKMIPYKAQQSTIRSVAGENEAEYTPRDGYEDAVPYGESSPPRVAQHHLTGIALSYHGRFSPIENLSPRVRLEPATPEFQPQYAAVGENMPQAQLFREDLSGNFIPGVDFSVASRIEAQSYSVTGIAAVVSYEPDETRQGSPSPRVHMEVSTRSLTQGGPGGTDGNISRTNSGIPRVPSANGGSNRNSSGHNAVGALSRTGSGVTLHHGLASSRPASSRTSAAPAAGDDRRDAASTEVVVNLGAFASGVVEQVLRSAVAQQRTSPMAIPLVQ